MVWNSDSFKIPGSDGINFGLIKEFWVDLKDDFIRFMSEFHRNEKLSRGINNTFIDLIPKVESPRLLANFRMISMVGIIYKVLSKVLSNKLKKVI